MYGIFFKGICSPSDVFKTILILFSEISRSEISKEGIETVPLDKRIGGLIVKISS